MGRLQRLVAGRPGTLMHCVYLVAHGCGNNHLPEGEREVHTGTMRHMHHVYRLETSDRYTSSFNCIERVVGPNGTR